MGLITMKPSDKGKTEEQLYYIDNYFFPEVGCMKSAITDDEYLEDVLFTKESLNLRQKALIKLGIDESEVNEIRPVEFCGFSYSGDYMATAKYSSKYETTWLFFSESQVYMYNYIFDMTSDSKFERTEEYFYKDVTNFSSTTESVEFIVAKKGCLNINGVEKGSLDTSCFSIVVPGDKFTCATQMTPEIEKCIQGMKQKLREKKNI